MRISILIPTAGRHDSLRRCLKSIDVDMEIFIMARWRDDIPRDIYLDDRTICVHDSSLTVVQCHNTMASFCNNDFIPAADDIEFHPGAIQLAIDRLKSEFKRNGVVGFNQCNIPDGSKTAFMLIGNQYYKEYGLFHPEYEHFYADTDFGILATKRGKFYWEEDAKLNHYHPSVTGQPDEVHRTRRAEKLSYDSNIFQRRSEILGFSGLLHK